VMLFIPILLSINTFPKPVGEVKNMLNTFRKLFCIHVYEFNWDHKHGYVQECRKCGKND
jgi:hypothetical protein